MRLKFMKLLLIPVLLLFAIFKANAQTATNQKQYQPISFDYDLSGNRILRKVAIKKEKLKSKSIAEDNITFSVVGKNTYKIDGNGLDFSKITDISVYDLDGKKVYSYAISEKDCMIDLNNVCTNGYYVIKCVYKGCTYSKTVVVK